MKFSKPTRLALLLFAVIVFVYLLLLGKSVYDKMNIDPNPEILKRGQEADTLIIQHFDGLALKNKKPDVEIAITDKIRIQFIVSHLKAIPHPRNISMLCACTGNPWIIFKQNGKDLCLIEVHHAELINCSWDKRSGYELSPDVIPELKAYFKELNFPEYVDEK